MLFVCYGCDADPMTPAKYVVALVMNCYVLFICYWAALGIFFLKLFCEPRKIR